MKSTDRDEGKAALALSAASDATAITRRMWPMAAVGIALTWSLSVPPAIFGQIDCAIAQISDEIDADFGGGDLSTASPWIAFGAIGISELGTGFEVFRANLRTGVRENLTDAPGYDGNPTIDRGGGRIAFESENDLMGNNPDGNREIFLLDVATRRVTQVTQSTSFGNFRPLIDDTGERILFTTSNDLVGENPLQLRQAFLFDIDQASLSQLTHLSSSLAGARINSLATLLVFAAAEDLTGGNPEGNEEIFLLDIGTRALTQLTQTSVGRSSFPSISDNGQRVVFLSDAEELIGSNPDGLYEVVLHDRGQGTFARLSNVNPNFSQAVISPDGNRVLMGLNFNLILHDVSTGAQEVFVDQPGITTFGSTNPDGTLISFRSNQDLTGGNSDNSFELFLAACAPLPLFGDNFEGGDTSAWSNSVGG